MKNRQGILVALPDNDVKSGTPENFAINTDYTTLNLKVDDINPNLGVINANFTSAGNVPGTNKLVFRKVLDPNYPQFFYFGFNQTKSTLLLSSQYGMEFDLDIFGDRKFLITKIGNILEMRYMVSSFYTPVGGDDLTGVTFQFQYAFYLNEAI